jgi:hypothetical protein
MWWASLLAFDVCQFDFSHWGPELGASYSKHQTAVLLGSCRELGFLASFFLLE